MFLSKTQVGDPTMPPKLCAEEGTSETGAWPWSCITNKDGTLFWFSTLEWRVIGGERVAIYGYSLWSLEEDKVIVFNFNEKSFLEYLLTGHDYSLYRNEMINIFFATCPFNLRLLLPSHDSWVMARQIQNPCPNHVAGCVFSGRVGILLFLQFSPFLVGKH